MTHTKFLALLSLTILLVNGCMLLPRQYHGPIAERSALALVRCKKGLIIESIEGASTTHYPLTGPFTERDIIGLQPGQYSVVLSYKTSSYAATDSATISLSAQMGYEYVIVCQINSSKRTWKPIIYATQTLKFDVR